MTCTIKIKSAGKFIDFFVHDILDYTVLSRDAANFVKSMQVFHAKACVQEIVDILRDKIEMKRNQIETLFQGFDIAQKFCVKTDQKRLQQVLLNLVSNAVKFTEGGTITITFEVLSDHQLRIQVRDTGIGIRPEHRSKMFKMFGSVKDVKRKINTQGIGLGLVISQMIV